MERREREGVKRKIVATRNQRNEKEIKNWREKVNGIQFDLIEYGKNLILIIR